MPQLKGEKKTKQRGNGQGTIHEYRPGKFRWEITVGYSVDSTTGKKKRQSLSGVADSKRAAQKALRDVLTDKDRGLLAAPDTVTVSEYAERWLSRQQQVRSRSAMLYRQELGYALSEIGSMKVRDVRARHLKDLIVALSERVMTSGKGKGKPMSSRTLGKVITRLRSVFREAVSDQIIYANPMDGVKTPKAKTVERAGRVLDFPEAARFQEVGSALYAAGLARLWPAMFTAVSVGLRRGEVMGLSWEDVDLDRRVLHIRHARTKADRSETGSAVQQGATKTAGSRRDIPMPTSLVAMLQAHKERQAWEREVMGEDWREIGAVFATEQGEYTHPDNLNRALAALLEWSDPETFEERAKYIRSVTTPRQLSSLRAVVMSGEKLPLLSPHDLRHTYATLALRKGVPVEVVSKTLGHAKVSMTLDVYRHVLDSEQRQATVDLFEAALPAHVSHVSPTN